MRVRIEYHCPYTPGEVRGYVLAKQPVPGGRCMISMDQYERACDHLPVGGNVGPVFHNRTPLVVKGGHGHQGFVIREWTGVGK